MSESETFANDGFESSWLDDLPGPGEPDAGHVWGDSETVTSPWIQLRPYEQVFSPAYMKAPNPPPFDRRSFADSWAVAGAIQEGRVHTPAEVAARVRLRALVAFLVGVVVGAGAVSLWL